MRVFNETHEEKFDKLHALFFILLLGAVILWVYQSGQVYKQKVQYDAQIRDLKSELDTYKNPEKFFQEEW